MAEAIINGLSGLTVGFQMLAGDWRNLIMLIVGFVLLYLGIKKDCEPLLLVPIGFGCILVNIPLSDVMSQEGFIRAIYDAGITTELFPLLIFVGIGAMTDFGPVLAKPSTFLLGAAGQFGIFLTLLLALALGFPQLDAVSIGIIGACDGPTAIYVTSKFAPHLLGAVSVAAYSYMSLVPIIQPPIMRLLTTKKERETVMKASSQAGLQDDEDPLPPGHHDPRRPHRPEGPAAPRDDHAGKPDAGIRRGGPADQGLRERDRQHRDPLPGPLHRRHDGGSAFVKPRP